MNLGKNISSVSKSEGGRESRKTERHQAYCSCLPRGVKRYLVYTLQILYMVRQTRNQGSKKSYCLTKLRPSQVALGHNPSAKAEDVRDTGSITGLGRSPGGGHGNPLQYSCLENPMDRGAWRATVHGVTKSQTQLK